MAQRLAGWAVWLGGTVAVLTGAVASDQGLWAVLQLSLGGLAFGVVGLILAIHTHNFVGWLCLGLQAAFGASLLGYTGLEIVLVAALLLVFPTGRIPSHRWRVAVVALGIAGSLAVVDLAVAVDDDITWLVFMTCVVPPMAASAFRIVGDYRRASGDLRLQLKWIAWILGVGGAVLAASLIPLPYLDDAHELAGLILIVGGPVAIGLAVSKYRLYEVNRIISRTVSYAMVLALFASLYAVMVSVAATRFDDSLSVAASTLVIAAAFQPVRRRVQIWVDQRFNRSRYDAEQVAAAFALTLHGRIDANDIVRGCLEVVTATVQPTQAQVWVRTSSTE